MIGIRPPPLQLKYDNTLLVRPSPRPRTILQRDSFFTRVYKVSWRKFVIAIAMFNAIRYIISASNSFQDSIIDHVEHNTKLARISFALSVLYSTSAMIEIYGTLSVFINRLLWIRVYTYLTFISVSFVTSANILTVITYFAFSDDLLLECTSLATQGKLHLKSTFRGQGWPYNALQFNDAQKKCLVAWSNESSYQAVSVFICTLLPSILYFILVYTFYRQVTDPEHSACLYTHRPRTGIRMEAHPEDCRPLYGTTSARIIQHATRRNRNPPKPESQRKIKHPKPKQQTNSESFKSSQKRKLERSRSKPSPSSNSRYPSEASTSQHQLKPLQGSAVMRSASPYRITPGPPSYAQSRGARMYSPYGARTDLYSAEFGEDLDGYRC